MVAIAGHIALDNASDARSSPSAANLAILALSVGVLAALFAARSQASSLLAVPLRPSPPLLCSAAPGHRNSLSGSSGP